MLVGETLKREAVLGAGASILAVAVAVFVIRPLHGGAVDYDSTASVIYFDRIITGRHLEHALAATPKPFLTVVFGILHSIFHDWRPLVWATIAAYGMSIGAAAVLARRVENVAAGAFVVIALVGAAPLLVDVSRAYAVAWAFLGWSIAGLALSAERPRFGIAAIALMLASLARIETLIIIVVGAIALVAGWGYSRWRHAAGPPRAAWLLLLALLALPIMFLHDWLLTGDPLFWARVSATFSASVTAAVASQGPGYMIGWVTRFVGGFGALAILAIVGFLSLIRQRRFPLALGLVALGPGVAAFLVFLAARGIFVSTRYAMPIELAILFAAGIGFGSLRIPWLRELLDRAISNRGLTWIRVPASAAGAILFAMVSAALLAKPFGPLDRATTQLIRTELKVAVDGDRLVPLVRRVLSTFTGISMAPMSGISDPSTASSAVILRVPGLQVPRFAVDIDLPRFRIPG